MRYLETVTKACALKFGESATTSLDILSGHVFMVTSLREDKLIQNVMAQSTIPDDSSQSQSQGERSTVAFLLAIEVYIEVYIEIYIGGLH